MSSEASKKKYRMPARVRCGICENCLRQDCGNCRFCLGKTKFGGDGKVTKEACINRRCKNLQVRAPKPLVEPKPEKKKRKRQSLPVPSAKKASSATQLTDPRESMHCYGCPVPKPTNDVCAGCLGTRDEQLNSEPILLCDGPGCNSEYHLQCCVPEMAEVPNGNYYCLDCSRGGSSEKLEKYVDRIQEERLEFDSSLDYVNEYLSILCERDEDVPLSELDRLSLLHSDAMSMPSRLIPNKEAPNDPKEPRQLGPDFLVGKPIRLYCPEGNQYHSGRILDYRKPAFSKSFWGSSSVSKHEFLILFPAGSESRKRSIKTWLLLEEHSCAVGVSHVWGQTTTKKGILGWRPAMTYLRSSIELAAVQTQLSVADKQVYMLYGSRPLPEHPSWALAHFLGSSGTQYALLNLKEESVDLFSEEMTKLRKLEGETIEKTRTYVGYALSENQEEERVKSWRNQVVKASLPKTHPRIFSAIDEDALGPIQYVEMKEKAGIALPCPSIPTQGISRQWLLKHLGDEKKYRLGLDLKCRSVGSSTEVINSFREQQIQMEFEESKEQETKKPMANNPSSESKLPESGDSTSKVLNGLPQAKPPITRTEQANKDADTEASPLDTVRTVTANTSSSSGREQKPVAMDLDDEVESNKVVSRTAEGTNVEELPDGSDDMSVDEPEPEPEPEPAGNDSNRAHGPGQDRAEEDVAPASPASEDGSGQNHPAEDGAGQNQPVEDIAGQNQAPEDGVGQNHHSAENVAAPNQKTVDAAGPVDEQDSPNHSAEANQSVDVPTDVLEKSVKELQPDRLGTVAGVAERASPSSTVTDSSGPKVGSGDLDTPDDDVPFGSGGMSDHGWSDAPENELKESPDSSTV